jgi:hypothetical protein
MSKPAKSVPTLLKQFLSNPIALIIYGLLNALFAAYFSSRIDLEIIFLSLTTGGFLGVGYWWAVTEQRDAYVQSFPGRVRFSRVLIRLKIENPNGDGEVYTGFEGTNESDMPRRKLGFETYYSTDDAVPKSTDDAIQESTSQPNTRVEGTLDGKAVKWDAWLTKQEEEVDKKTKIKRNKVKLNVDLDLGDRCPPRSKLPYHSFTVTANKMFLDAFNPGGYFWRYQPTLLTNEIIFELETKPPIRISDVWENVTDFWSELDTAEIQRLKEIYYARRTSDNSARLRIKHPIPSDTYYFYFTLELARP